MNGTAMRVRIALEAAGLDQAEAAARAGLTKAAWYALESHDDDLETCLSLREVRAVAGILNTDPIWLLNGEPAPPPPRLTPPDVARRIPAHLESSGLFADAFGDLAGWDVSEALLDPEAGWGWNVDGLRDVCGALGLDYRDAALGGAENIQL